MLDERENSNWFDSSICLQWCRNTEGKCFWIQILWIRRDRIEMEQRTARLLSNLFPVRLWAFTRMRCKFIREAFFLLLIRNLNPLSSVADPPYVYTYITKSKMYFNRVDCTPHSIVTPVALKRPTQTKSVSTFQIFTTIYHMKDTFCDACASKSKQHSV